MTLTPRQWTVVFGLIVFFGVMAVIVRQGDTPTSEFTDLSWCGQGARALEDWSGLVDGTAETAGPQDFEGFKQAMYDVEGQSPVELRQSMSQLVNFAIVAKQSLTDAEWPAAFDIAREQVDTVAVDEAFAAVTQELLVCGLEF